MYNIFDYGRMLADPRAGRYGDALRHAVRPGAVVVDLGTGTGIWALYACRLGARRVYAIEPADVIGVAIEAARASGFADRITFIPLDSRAASIDEPADVVVADLRDVLPLSGACLSGMMDARRFLRPEGLLIPQRDTLWVAAVQAPDAYHARVDPWDTHGLGFDFSAARRQATSLPLKERFDAAALLTPPASWATLDYQTLATAAASGAVRLVVSRPGMAHGLAVWFESDLIDGVVLSNRPGDPPLLYGQSFLPWPSPVELGAGDQIDVRLRTMPAGADSILAWRTVVAEAGTGRELASFVQSTFDSLPLSLANLPESGDGPGHG